jgi:anaerobic selenocysteine-containing dehydrogenase
VNITRRNFIRYGFLTAVSVALGACGRNVEHPLVSQYQMPEYKLPGQFLYWATACGECSAGCGVSVKTADGRAIKMEGIPEHPVSHGKVCARGSSAIQAVYHPNRLGANDGSAPATDWSTALPALKAEFVAGTNPLWIVRNLRGSLGGLMVNLAKTVGAKIWVLDYPSRVQERRVMKAVAGKAELPFYPLHDSDYAVVFGGDFLNNGHSPVHHGWAYGEFRQGQKFRGLMVSVGSRMNMTQASADRWLPVRPGTEGWVALAVGNLISAKKGGGNWPAWAKAVSLEKVIQVTGLDGDYIKRLADRLGAAKRPVVIADSDAGNYINGVDSLFIIHSLQKLLTGKIETFEPEMLVGVTGGVPKDMILTTQQALALLNTEKCGAAWVFDIDPMSILPTSLKFDDAFGKAGKRTAFATFPNATTDKCDLVLPVQTWVEEWGDQRIQGASGDIYNIQQPAVETIWTNTRSTADILAYLKTGSLSSAMVDLPGSPTPEAAGAAPILFHDMLEANFKGDSWVDVLHRGGVWKESSLDWEHYENRVSAPPPLVANSGKLPACVSPYANMDAIKVTSWGDKAQAGATLVPYATLALGDGSLGPRPWLQELPDPMTTAVWGSWVEINEDWAREQQIERHDLLEVQVGDLTLKAPAFPLPSMHRDTVAIPVGDERADFSKWADHNYVDFGKGNDVFGPYGWTNKGYGKKGVNPLRIVNATLSAASGEPMWVNSSVSIKKLDKKEMITAMDLRVFNLPRMIIPVD